MKNFIQKINKVHVWNLPLQEIIHLLKPTVLTRKFCNVLCFNNFEFIREISNIKILSFGEFIT